MSPAAGAASRETPSARGSSPRSSAHGKATTSASRVPAAGTRDALVVAFPWALDRGLLQRALGVSQAAAPVAGDIAVDSDDRAWRFTPAAPWAAGPHELVVLTLLEDPAGNRVGRPFEIEMFTSRRGEDRESVPVHFTIR